MIRQSSISFLGNHILVALYSAVVNLRNSQTCSIYTTIGGLSSKFDEFLAGRSQFDSDHGVDFYVPTCCQSATFVRPLFAFYCPLFYCPLFFTEKNNK